MYVSFTCGFQGDPYLLLLIGIITYHKLEFEEKEAQLGVPHSKIQVELGFILQAGTCQILNFA